jgi:hypothetical protein
MSMMRLDRDRTPVLFALVTSVLSGVIIAAILKAFSSGIADNAVLVWIALAAGGAAAVWPSGWTFLTGRRRSARVFLMTSAFSQKY